MEKQPDQKKADELLGKLKQSFLTSEKTDHEVDVSDDEDVDFREKLAGMLQQVTGDSALETREVDKTQDFPEETEKSAPSGEVSNFEDVPQKDEEIAAAEVDDAETAEVVVGNDGLSAEFAITSSKNAGETDISSSDEGMEDPDRKEEEAGDTEISEPEEETKVSEAERAEEPDLPMENVEQSALPEVTETQPEDEKPTGAEVTEVESEDEKPSEVEVAETETEDEKSTEAEVSETETEDEKPSEVEVAETETEDEKSTEAEVVEAEPEDEKSTGAEVAEAEPEDEKSTEAEVAAAEPEDEKPTEAEVSEAEPEDEKSTEAEVTEKKTGAEGLGENAVVENNPKVPEGKTPGPILHAPREKVTVSAPISAQIKSEKVAGPRGSEEPGEKIRKQETLQRPRPEKVLEKAKDQSTEKAVLNDGNSPEVREPDSSQPKKNPSKKIPSKKQSGDVFARVQSKSGLSADDIEIMFSLGYEHELGRLIGYDLLDEVKMERLRLADQQENGTLSAFSPEEGEKDFQFGKEDLLKFYTNSWKRWKVRLIGMILFTVATLVADFPNYFFPWVAEEFKLFPEFFPLVECLLLIGATIHSYHLLYEGFIGIQKSSPTPYSVISIVLPISLIFSIFRIWVEQTRSLPVAFLTCCIVLLFTIYEGLRLHCECKLFGVISSGGKKIVLKQTSHRKKQLRKGKTVVKIINDDVDEPLYRVRQTVDISGFLRRWNDMSTAKKPFLIFLYSMFTLTVLAGFAVLVYTDRVSLALKTALLTLLMVCPMLGSFIYLYPICRANRLLMKNRCALLGEESVEEYRKPKRIIFDEGDLFHAQSCTRVFAREGEDFEKMYSLVNALLLNICGICEEGASQVNTHSVTRLQIVENGVEALVDEHFHLVAGNAIFLKRKGIHVPPENPGRALHRADNVSLIHVAVEDTLQMSFEITYEVNPKFTKTVWKLMQSGSSVAIRSFDPNINEAFIHSVGVDPDGDIRVLKLGHYEAPDPIKLVDSGVVVMGGKSNLPRPLYAACQIYRLRRIGYGMQGIAMALGTVVAMALGLGNAVTLSPALNVLAILLYHTVWTLSGYALVNCLLRPRIPCNRKRNR